jgi:acyl-coenzyme A thioesterase PaaI-like protein
VLQLLPWEIETLPPVPSLTPDELEPAEAQFLATVRAAHARAQAAGTAVEDELLHFTWHPSNPDRAHGELTIGPELGNRVGHLQGGALYATGARVASQALDDGGWALAEGSYQFLRPGDGHRLIVRAEVLRRGRTVAFVQAYLSVDEVLIGAGMYTFRAAEEAPRSPSASA